MAEILEGIQGSFILSLNDHEEVRKIFNNFHIKEVETTYTISGNDNSKKVGELIISNVNLNA